MNTNVFSLPIWTILIFFWSVWTFFFVRIQVFGFQIKRNKRPTCAICIHICGFFSSQIYFDINSVISWPSEYIWIFVQSIFWYPNILDLFSIYSWEAKYLDINWVISWPSEYIWIIGQSILWYPNILDLCSIYSWDAKYFWIFIWSILWHPNKFIYLLWPISWYSHFTGTSRICLKQCN